MKIEHIIGSIETGCAPGIDGERRIVRIAAYEGCCPDRETCTFVHDQDQILSPAMRTGYKLSLGYGGTPFMREALRKEGWIL